MTKWVRIRVGTFATLAVVAVVAAMVAYGAQLDDNYTPSCEDRVMHPGDFCFGTGGGTYDQLVADHYLFLRGVSFVALPLALVFACYAMGEARRDRRRRQEADDPLR